MISNLLTKKKKYCHHSCGYSLVNIFVRYLALNNLAIGHFGNQIFIITNILVTWCIINLAIIFWNSSTPILWLKNVLTFLREWQQQQLCWIHIFSTILRFFHPSHPHPPYQPIPYPFNHDQQLPHSNSLSPNWSSLNQPHPPPTLGSEVRLKAENSK